MMDCIVEVHRFSSTSSLLSLLIEMNLAEYHMIGVESPFTSVTGGKDLIRASFQAKPHDWSTLLHEFGFCEVATNSLYRAFQSTRLLNE